MISVKKKCSRCKCEKELDYFAISKKKKYGRASECKECHKIYRDNYYRRNKQTEIKRIAARRSEIRNWFLELKAILKCAECGEMRAVCLQFHHDNPNLKEKNISNAITYGWSKERILKEAEKCTVLCANCHIVYHATIAK